MSIFQLDFDKKYDILDMTTPRLVELSGRYKQSFAFTTLHTRLPIILTGIIDYLHREWDALVAEYGEEADEDVKKTISVLSGLKYELQTDKPFKFFSGDAPDVAIWNKFIRQLPIEKRTYYRSCWLYAECYLYRRIYAFFRATTKLRDHDYFAKQKRDQTLNSDKIIVLVSQKTRHLERNEATLIKMLKINLWGNRCDLSITAGKEADYAKCNPFDMSDEYEKNLLVDETSAVWKCLNTADQSKPRQVDVICDNAGYELYTDLLLADYLIDKRLATKVRFHVKAQPWFISDVMHSDFHWALQYFKKHPHHAVNELGAKWLKYLKEGQFELAPLEYFWTSPYEFYRMRDVVPELYNKLSESILVIVKGDLNYRKLIGDFNWDCTQDFLTCLRGFQPTNLCSLRTIKADLICGLPEGKAYELNKKSPDWMISGEFGTIHFEEKMGCNCHL